MSPTKVDLDLELSAAVIASQAIVLIRSRYEEVPFPQRLRYHNTVHTLGVQQRAVEIARAMCLSTRHVALVTIVAAFHDSVQAWHPVEKGNGVAIRQRHACRNELASLQEMVCVVSDPALSLRLTPEEYGIAASGFIATIPEWSAEHKTVVQPFLTPCSHPVARAVALADLGSAGMDPECFVREGPALFAEEQLDIMSALITATRASDIIEPVQYSYRSRYVAWLESQAGFAKGRQALLAKELKGLSAGAADRVRALFNRFDESIELAEAAVAKAKSEDFVTLMRQLLPTAFPKEGK